MKERPILFSSAMVRALLAGTKTQTRRALRGFYPRNTPEYNSESGRLEWFNGDEVVCGICCPYGQSGDRLWVRETWAARHEYDGHKPAHIPALARWHYSATEDRGGLLWRPSIHMPRWASRITLEVTEVRVERLQDITHGDIEAEGIPCGGAPRPTLEQRAAHCSAWRSLWESINGPGSWDANPWVWAVSFRRIESEAAQERRVA